MSGFRRSFVLILVAVMAVAAGSVLYWQQVTQRLATDARESIVVVSRELTDNFERLLGAELQVLTALAVSLEESGYLQQKTQLVSYLSRQNRRNSFEMMGSWVSETTAHWSLLSALALLCMAGRAERR